MPWLNTEWDSLVYQPASPLKRYIIERSYATYSQPFAISCTEVMKFNEPGRKIEMNNNQSISDVRARTWKRRTDVLSFHFCDEGRGGEPSVSVHVGRLTHVINSIFNSSLLPP